MSLQEAIEIHGRENLGLDSYPVLGETYRIRLNDLIINEYMHRELGHETFSLWRFSMRRKMQQIMPVYNKLYATDTLIVDPLRTIDLRTLTTTDSEEMASSEQDVTAFGTGENTATSGSTSRNVGSDTPQVFLSDNGNYASSATDGRADASATNTETSNSNNSTDTETNRTGHDVMDSTTVGFQGSQADLLLAYRSTIINIDMMIVNELESLFMGIFNNGDPYFNRRNFTW